MFLNPITLLAVAMFAYAAYAFMQGARALVEGMKQEQRLRKIFGK